MYLEALPNWEESAGVIYFVAPHCPCADPVHYVLCEKHKGKIHTITGHEGPEG